MSDMVSVVVPIYNAADFLGRCVESILGQSHENLELVLVNDGSKDDSLEICRFFESRDKRVVVVDQPNGGASAARYAGVNVAKGQWISFVDADDVIPPDSIHRLLKSSCDCDIVIGQVAVNSGVVWNYPSFEEEMSYKTAIEYLFGGRIHSGPVAKLYRQGLFDDELRCIPREITHGEDFLMNCVLFQRAHKIKVIEECVYNYVYRDASVSNGSNPYVNLSYCRMQEKCLHSLIKKENKFFMEPLLRRLTFVHRRRVVKGFIKKMIGR